MDIFNRFAINVISKSVAKLNFCQGGVDIRSLIKIDDFIPPFSKLARSPIEISSTFLELAKNADPYLQNQLVKKMLMYGGAAAAGGLSYLAWKKYGKAIVKRLFSRKKAEDGKVDMENRDVDVQFHKGEGREHQVEAEEEGGRGRLERNQKNMEAGGRAGEDEGEQNEERQKQGDDDDDDETDNDDEETDNDDDDDDEEVENDEEVSDEEEVYEGIDIGCAGDYGADSDSDDESDDGNYVYYYRLIDNYGMGDASQVFHDEFVDPASIRRQLHGW